MDIISNNRSNRAAPRSSSHTRRERDSEQTKDDNPVKVEPNFNLSGNLAADTNTFNGVVVKYSEPAEARKPTGRWRLYVFKGEEQIDLLHVHRQSAYLLGRDRKVADIPIDHPSCSKQHAVLQYRQLSHTDDYGETNTQVKPYIIDLDTTNGTYVNSNRIPPSRYVELFHSDVIKFGYSTREYVLLQEEQAEKDAE
ncbi:3608_t:CDS:2 [Paraglomus occultum]|uniref:3608_t:CDS:1 n=1 Tax=Paraglomus occultum TaxID=144539 RepID=A0A9N9G1D7_9GLOM|nr:3608_t:CDS:2 [Paraglomus occultum]